MKIGATKSIIIFKWYKNIPLLLFLFLLTTYLKAQPPVVFRSYTVKEGLSHNFVRHISQDSQGFIWIATIDGLNKFDGYTFETYKLNSKDSTSIPNNNVTSFAEDKNGNLWIGTWGGGVCIYDRKSDSFRRISQHKETPDEEALSKLVYVIFKDSKERIWIGTSDRGLFLADTDKFTFTRYGHDPGNNTSISYNSISSITEDENGKLWIGTYGGGLNHFDPDTEQFIRYMHRDDDVESPGNNTVTNVFFDSKKRLWIASSNNTISLMKKDQSGKFIHFKHQPGDPKSIGNYHITAIEENDDKIWIGTDYGLMLYNEKDRNFHHYHARPFDPESLTSSQVKMVYSDNQERLWVGTYNGGINVFDKSFIKILHYHTFYNENSLSFNDVSSFLQNDDGSMLVGTDGGGLNAFDRNTGRFIHYKYNPQDPGSIGGNFIKSMLKDQKGRIWIGLWGEGINLFDRKKQVFIPYKKKEWGNDWLSNDNVTCLTEDLDGFIWASTWGRGVFRFNPDDNTFEHLTLEEDRSGSLSGVHAWAIFSDSKNNIWVGNSNGVLDLYDRNKRKFIHFDTKLSEDGHYGILVIFEDKKGRIWVGLEGGGLKLLNRETGTFQTYTTENGLSSDYVSSIEEDERGYLWLGTNAGMVRFDPDKEVFKVYDLSYGIQILQFNRQASTYLESGEMMFGGVNGFSIFHPDSLTERDQKIPVVLTDFQIFNKPVSIGKKGSPLNSHINETSEITLSHYQSVFSIEYAGLNFSDPQNTRYKYRLIGFVDEGWQDAGNERKVTYTNLEPGSYTFEVALANIGDSSLSRTLSITVTPPWWGTLVAKLSAILIVIGGLIAFYRLRVNGIKRHNRKLEEEVADRTSNLKKLNKELTLSQQNLKLAYDQVRLTTDALNQIAFIVKGDADGRITEVNDMFLETTGYDKSEIIGKNSDELSDSLLSSGIHSKEFFEEMSCTLKQGDTWRGEVCYRTKSGDFIWLLKNVIPLHDHGSYTGFFSFSYDITHRKQQEEEIVEAKRIAEEASETKESFLSIMSHEIRTPLNSVIGLSNILLKRNPREDQLEIVKTLKTSGDNLMYLINNILDYNKIRAGKIELENLPFNLDEQLRLLQFSHQHMALEKGLDFTISITSNTPSQLVGDSIRLNQILNNLLSNALKFTLKGYVKLSVSLKSSDDDICQLLFVIRDSGIGISEENLTFLFTPFHQSEKYISRKFGGTGLGLSIVKDLVDLFRGSISVDSKEEKGTTFSVTLPFKLCTEVAPLDTTKELQMSTTASMEGYRILYVEDVESNQTLVKNFMDDYNIECITASNGDIALMHTSTKTFDVILMDLQMPVMNGYEVTKAIRNQENGKNLKAPVIAFTAESYSETLKSKITKAGMQELMTKPFRFDHLIEKILKVCPQRTSEDSFFTLQYYEWVFNYDRKKLNDFRLMLLKDFRKFETEINEYDSKESFAEMRSEIHKMMPIVKNLNCIILLDLFEKFQEHSEYNLQVKKLTKKLNLALQDFFSELDVLHY